MLRPDDFHMAMRADLVCILRDVVGLIARIEATLLLPEPVYPQPAHSPGAQDEGSGRHGDDQRAQKLEAVGATSKAGAAEAGIERADRRNSSRPAGEVASAPLPVDRTPVSKQPTVAALPPSAAPAEPPAAPTAPQPAPQEAQKLSKPTLIKRADDEPPVAGFAKPVERKPFDRPKSSPLNPRPGRLAGVTITSPGSVVSIDMGNFVVACPGGDWQTSRPVALIMERMRNGDTFADETLADLGSMGTESFRESRKRWSDELAQRGVSFVRTNHVGCRIEVAGQ